jgi:hypothetical protein
METPDENTGENQQIPPNSNWGAVKVVKVELELYISANVTSVPHQCHLL